MAIRLRVVCADVCDRQGDALLLPVTDEVGQLGGEAAISRSLGRVARAFHRRFPDVDLVDAIDAEVDYPLRLGEACAVELTEAPYARALLLCMLPHRQDAVEPESLRRITTGAFARALELASAHDARHVVTPLLTGGWRLSRDRAVTVMLGVLGQTVVRGELTVEVCVLEDADADLLRELARSAGFGEV